MAATLNQDKPLKWMSAKPVNSKRIIDYYKRWNIEVDQDEELTRFKNRLLAAIDLTVGDFIVKQPGISTGFSLVIGHRQPVVTRSAPFENFSRAFKEAAGIRGSFADTHVYRGIDSAANQHDLIFALQCLFWILGDRKCPKLDEMVHAVRQAVDVSPSIDFGLAKRGYRVTLHPKGARFLDTGVVDDTLGWLRNHPAAAKHFENALGIYLTKDIAHYRNLLDELRSALERLLRSLLDNKKSLENQRKPLLQWMQTAGVHIQVSNLYNELVFNYFAQYQNDAVKHGDGWKELEVEYMIYLTGTFIRFLLQLNQEP